VDRETLRLAVYEHFADTGAAPTAESLAQTLGASPEEIRSGLGQQMLDDIDSTFSTGPYELLLPKWDDHYQLDLLPWLTSKTRNTTASTSSRRP